MAKAPIESSTSEPAESPLPTLLGNACNVDSMTLALRSGQAHIGMDELINLNRNNSPPTVASSSAVPTAVSSSRKESSVTKPTSYGTSYPVEGYNGKGKEPVKTYASSCSATRGSDSDTELEAFRDNALAGMGGWTADGTNKPRPLKGPAKNVKRSRPIRRAKAKKPPIIIHREEAGNASSSEEEGPADEQVPRSNGRDAKYLRQRRNKVEHDQLDLAHLEEGRVSEPSTSSPPVPKPLSRPRFYTMIGLCILMVLTVALATFAAHYTGKARMHCTKGVIFAATVLISIFTVLTMVTVRRTLQEALQAGLLMFLIGFALVVEIHDFM